MKTGLAILGLAAVGLAAWQTAGGSGTAINDTVAVPDSSSGPTGIAVYASNAGFSGRDLQVAVAIALAESGGRYGPPDGDQTLSPSNGPSKGLWQINTGNRAHPEFRDWDLYDPQINANAAYSIYVAAGMSFRPWSTYPPAGQQYLLYMDRAVAIVGT